MADQGDDANQLPKDDFAALLRRAKTGDEEASAALLREFGPSLARIVRVRLTNNVRRDAETQDVCQSVFGDIFLRLRLGAVEFESSGAFLTYLTKIARSRIVSRARRLATIRRDSGRMTATPIDDISLAGATPTPSVVVSNRELLTLALARMNPEQRRIAELRIQGMEWGEIAKLVGGRDDAVRINFQRALARIARECQI